MIQGKDASDAGSGQDALRIPRTIGYFAAFASLGLIMASLGPTLPGLAEHTRTGLSEISFLFMARSLGNLLGSFWAGRLYNRAPGHSVMAATLVIIAFLLFSMPLAGYLSILTTIALIFGVAQRVLDVGGITMVAWIWNHKLGSYMNALHIFLGMGALASPILIALVVAATGDITWAYWALSLILLPVAAWLIWIRSPRPQGRAGEEANMRFEPVLITLVGVFLFLHVGAEHSYSGWLFSYTVKLGLGSEATAAYLTSAFWASFTAGLLLAVPLTARFSPRQVLVADIVGCLFSLSILLIWPDSLCVLWIGTVGMGLSMASIFPTTVALVGQRSAITGRLVGWLFVGGSAGGMTLPWVIGQLFDRKGPQATMYVILIDLAVAFLALQATLLYIGRSQRRNPIP